MLAAVAQAGAVITARQVAATAIPIARLMSTAVHARRAAPSEPEYEKVPEAANLEVLQRLSNGSLPHHQLEKEVDPLQAVKLRRAHISQSLDNVESLENLPVSNFDSKHFYESVHGTNCECVIGYVPLPVGMRACWNLYYCLLMLCYLLIYN
jgi:hydroxymethylglutaryl-CoA reductase (NADPH)